jgi:phosphoserine phosphatase
MIVATLAHPVRLASSVLASARAALTAAGARVDGGWLEEGAAIRLTLDGIDPIDARTALARFGKLADVIVHVAPRKPFRLFVADMDSTMIACECLDELADYAGFKPQVAAITERAMQGELDFAAALVERVALLEGMPEATIAECLATRVRPNPGARTLIATLAANGIRTMLVSGGFTAFAEPLGDMLGFDRVVANTLETIDGRLTGMVALPIVDSNAKRAALIAEAGARGGPARAIAIGDGANDVAMVEAAGLGLAYRPKAALAAVADGSIRHGDLTGVLWALGIPRALWTVLP